MDISKVSAAAQPRSQKRDPGNEVGSRLCVSSHAMWSVKLSCAEINSRLSPVGQGSLGGGRREVGWRRRKRGEFRFKETRNWGKRRHKDQDLLGRSQNNKTLFD